MRSRTQVPCTQSLVLPQASSGDGTSRGCYMLIVVEGEEEGSEMNSVLLCCVIETVYSGEAAEEYIM